MPKRFVIVKGPDQGKTIPLSEDSSTLFGRGKNAEGRLNDPHVSRVHCEVELLKGNRVLLTDLESRGTFVNGKRIEEAFLKAGDVVKVGETELRLQDDTAADAGTAPPPLAQPVKPKTVILTSERLQELSGRRLSHYQVGDLLARGQSGLVFKANDFKNDREVALKVLWPEFAADEEEMRRFVRAMKTMLPLRHPNLVSLYGAGKTGPYCWVAMELVQGEGLQQVIGRISTTGMLDWRKVIRIIYHLARGLEYAHSQGVIHRNITPPNVLLGQSPDETKLGDLMLAKAMESNTAQQITKPGQVVGDVRYMAPERGGMGSASADGRSDIYSLGALTYGLLTGRPPFEGANLIETLTKIRKDKPVPPKKYQAAIADEFEALCLKMLAKRPEDRFQTAAELIKAMQKVANTHGFALA